jgi:hypothetical protein
MIGEQIVGGLEQLMSFGAAIGPSHGVAVLLAGVAALAWLVSALLNRLLALVMAVVETCIALATRLSVITAVLVLVAAFVMA